MPEFFEDRRPARQLVAISFGLLLVAIFVLALAFGLAKAETNYVLFVTVALIIFLTSFINAELVLYILVFSFLLSPEFFLGVASQPGDVTATADVRRAVTVRFDDILLLIIALSWLARSAIHKELGLFLRTPLNRPILLFVLAYLMSTAIGWVYGWVPSIPRAGLFLLKYTEYFAVYFILVNHLENDRQIRRFLAASFITCAIVSAYAMFQIPTGARVSAPFEGGRGEPNTLGGYLVFMLGVALGLLLKAKSDMAKLVWTAVAVMIVVPMFYTLSRSTYLALLPMLIALGILSEKRIYVGAALSLLVLGLLWFPGLMPQRVRSRVEETWTQARTEGQVEWRGYRFDTSLSARLDTWEGGYNAWSDHPISIIFGRGVTGAGFLDGQYMRVLVETGLMGMGAFLWLLISIFREAKRVLVTVTDELHQGLAMGYLAGFVGLMVHGLGANTFIIIRIMMPLMFFTAMMIMLPTMEAKLE